MNPVQFVALLFVVLGLLSFVRWWRRGFPKSAKFPFWAYLLMLAGVWAILFIAAWAMGGDEMRKLAPIFTGYAIGAVTVYIAAHAIQR
jgi:hypothetical protein